MSVDPTDPDTFEDDFEDDESAGFPDAEAPEADAAEQHAELLQHRDVPMTGRDFAEADPADAYEQARVVELNEDEYR